MREAGSPGPASLAKLFTRFRNDNMSRSYGASNVSAPPPRRFAGVSAAGAAILLLSSACGAPAPPTLGVRDGALAPCPPTPNCVHTADPDVERRAPPFELGPGPVAWARAVEVVERMTRTRVVSATETYLHAEARSLVFRFVDDLELLLEPEDGEIVVRSASRVGRSDLGVNRGRVERLRVALREADVIR